MSHKSHGVRIRLTPEQVRLLERLAARYGQSTVEWLYDVIRREIQMETRWPKKAA